MQRAPKYLSAGGASASHEGAVDAAGLGGHGGGGEDDGGEDLGHDIKTVGECADGCERWVYEELCSSSRAAVPCRRRSGKHAKKPDTVHYVRAHEARGVCAAGGVKRGVADCGVRESVSWCTGLLQCRQAGVSARLRMSMRACVRAHAHRAHALGDACLQS